VNPNLMSSTVGFEYGTTKGSYIHIISASPSVISGSNDFNESATISFLAPATTYYFRVKAVNSFGTTYGKEMTFVTAQ
jgi:hypothetical protein